MKSYANKIVVNMTVSRLLNKYVLSHSEGFFILKRVNYKPILKTLWTKLSTVFYYFADKLVAC